MPFFKREGETIHTAGSVYGPGHTLTEEDHAAHTYPVDGWWWAPDLDAAIPLLQTSVDVVPFRFGAAAILASGMLGPDVKTPSQMDAAIEAIIQALPPEVMPDTHKPVAILSWHRAPEIHRDNPLVAIIAAVKGMDEKSVDALFATARAMQAAELAR